MTINERQTQALETCMPSCRNLAYPTCGGIEEHGEYIEKLLERIEWNPEFNDRERLESLLRNIVDVAKQIGIVGKQVRHGTVPVPFSLKVCDEALIHEMGDRNWNHNVEGFYLTHPDGTDPTVINQEFEDDYKSSIEMICIKNYDKLQQRLKNNTIDGQGDNERKAFE